MTRRAAAATVVAVLTSPAVFAPTSCGSLRNFFTMRVRVSLRVFGT